MFNWSSCAYVFASQWSVFSSLTTVLGRCNNRIEVVFRTLSLSLISFYTCLSASCHYSLEVVKFLLQYCTALCRSCNKTLCFWGFGSRLRPTGCCLLLGSSSLMRCLPCNFLLVWSVGVHRTSCARTSTSQWTMVDIDSLFFINSKSFWDSAWWEN